MHDENCILLRNGHWFTHHISGIMTINIVAYKTLCDLWFNLVSHIICKY